MSTFGKRLKSIRISNKLNQQDFAEMLGLKHNVTISRWEQDNQKPETEILIKLVKLFNVNLHWLYTGDGAPYNNISTSMDDSIMSYSEGFKEIVNIFEKVSSMLEEYLDNVNPTAGYRYFNNCMGIIWLSLKDSLTESTLINDELLLTKIKLGVDAVNLILLRDKKS